MKFIKTMLKEKSGEINSNLSAPAIGNDLHYKPRRTMIALEPRIMFDGAAVETVADAAAEPAPTVQDAAAIEAAKLAEAAADVAPPAVQAEPAPARTEILFIESNVNDYQMLIDGAKPGTEVHVLDASQDGLAQMAQILDGRSGIDAIHIVSHGSEASVGLGSLTLTAQNLSDHAADLAAIGHVLNQNADILLYGCNVAQGSDGEAFIEALTQATQADIAASTDATGTSAFGGDWNLESNTGPVETALFADGQVLSKYSSLLATGTMTFTADDAANFADGIAEDGNGGSSDLPGIVIQVLNISDTSGTNVGVAMSWQDATALANSVGFSGLTTFDGGLSASGWKGMEIKSSDGSEFQINQFSWYDWGWVGGTVNVVGYQNGSQVTSTTFTANSSDAIATVALGSGFDYVDDVRITYASGNGWSTINNIAIADAVQPLAITSATYDASTNSLVVTGTGMTATGGAANDIDVTKLTLTGQGGAIYTLTSSNVEIDSATQFTVALNAVDQINVEGLLNKNGTSSVGGTTFNIAAAANWDVANTGNADLTGNGVTVSNVQTPTITSSTYDANTGSLVVTGTNFVKASGATNDITANKLTFTGEGGATYTLTDTSNVEITSGTAFTITLSATDKAAINQMINKNGTSSTGNTTYNLAAADDWNTVITNGDISDATGNGITVSNVAVPAITSSTYDASTGALVVTGTGFLSKSGATNDIVANKFTFTGEGGATYTLTDTSNVEITSGTAFTITLSATDKAAINQMINKNGTSSTSGTTYNLAAAEDWTAGAAAGVTDADLAGNGITASNVAVPAITSSTYDASTGALVVTGTGFLSKSGATNDILANKFTFTGEGGATYTLTDTSNVEITSGTAFTITLSATDKAAINQMINKNGTSSTSGTTYNLAAAEDWTAGAAAGVTDADLTGNGITVSNVAVPAITSATYDYTANILVVTGTGFLSKSGATNDIDLTKLTIIGEGGATYTLTNATGVEITSDTSFSVTLSGADLTNVEALLNKDGTSAVSTATYNLSAAVSWNRGDATNGSDTTNAITVSNYAAPTVTSATYDASTNVLTVTGTNLVSKSGATNDVAVSLLTLTGEGGTYTLTSSNVEITDATTFSVTLNAADQIVVRGLLNKNGTSSSGSTTYNLAAAEDWMAGTAAATVVADLTGNGITVSNVQAPTITSSTYDSDTGILTVTGTNLFSKVGANNDIDLTKLTFTGQGSGTYTLTNATGVEITSATSFTTTLTGADKTNVDALMNKIGTSANDSTTYNLAAADDWMAGADAAANIADATNAITVSIAPKITSATYDAATGSLVVTGTNMQAKAGATNDITAAKLTFTGEGGVTYTLTDTADVELTSATSFTLALSATDQAAINQIVNKNGTASTGGTTYNLAAADDWDAQVTAGDTSDLTGNGITASNVAVPAITSSTYDATTGALVVTGTGFLSKSGATNDIVANKFTFTGEGGATYTLTDTSNVEITSGTAFTITLSATDKAVINQMLNKNGTSSTGATTYNLAAAEDWTAGAAAGVTDADLTGNGITVSNVAVPAITSSTYDATTGALVVTGTSFLSKSGATNDIVANKFTFTGEGGATYTLTDTSNVEITSGTAFTITLSATDKAAINQMLNKNGTSSTGATTYNLAAAEDWTAGAAAGVTDADLAGNGITVSNVAVPAITSSTYDATTGALVVTGTGFLSKSGATNDIVANKFTFTGEGGATYTLTDTSNVEITSGTAFTITLSATDKAAINQMLNKNGTSSTGATTYNLAAAEDWTAGAAAGVTDADLTGNGITVSNVAVPTITSATYVNNTGVLVVTGANFLKLVGANNDIDASKLTFTGQGGATYTLTGTAGVEITSATEFTLTLAGADKAGVNALFNKTGLNANDNTVYNLAAAEDWAAGADVAVVVADLTNNGITVTANVPPTSSNGVITVNEDTSYTFVANDFNFSDVDPGNVLTQVQITALPSTGTLALNGISVTINQVITKADIDAGKLTFRGAPDAFGTANASFQFKVHDGTEYSSTSYTETMNITAVNDIPTFTKGADQTVNEDAGAQTVANWATGLSTGPANESGQILSFITSNNNNALFSVQPTIDSNGNLIYTPAANANGTATVTVSIRDSGGTANGGVDTSASQTFTITVNPVNDLPTGTVTISGTTPIVGTVLTATNTLADVDGLGAIRYQWKAGGVDISGATGNSYVLTDAEVGKTITVVAIYTDGQGTVENVASAATAQVEALAPINLTQQMGNSDAGTGNNTNTNTNTGNNTGTSNNTTGTGNRTNVGNNNTSDTHSWNNSNSSPFDNSSSGNNNSNSSSSSNQAVVVDMKLGVDSHGNGSSGGTINIPASAFAGMNMFGEITISATQSSGQSLPSFISVNPSTGAVTVKEGAVITHPITVKVTIRDSQGRQVVVLVKVQPQKNNSHQQNQGQDQDQDQQPDNGDSDNSQGQGRGQNRQSQLEQADKGLAQAGKPGLTRQLQMAGSKGFEFQRQKLLDSLASLVSNDQDAA